MRSGYLRAIDCNSRSSVTVHFDPRSGNSDVVSCMLEIIPCRAKRRSAVFPTRRAFYGANGWGAHDLKLSGALSNAQCNTFSSMSENRSPRTAAHVDPRFVDPFQAYVARSRRTCRGPTFGSRNRVGPDRVLALVVHQHAIDRGFVVERVCQSPLPPDVPLFGFARSALPSHRTRKTRPISASEEGSH